MRAVPAMRSCAAPPFRGLLRSQSVLITLLVVLLASTQSGSATMPREGVEHGEAFAVGVPFRVSVKNGVKRAFLSTSRSCTERLLDAGECTPVTKSTSTGGEGEASCVFTVPLAAVNATVAVYACSDAGLASAREYKLGTDIITPKAAFTNIMTTFQLSEKVPVGAQVQFYKSDTCNYDPVGRTIMLPADRQISVTAPETDMMYLCAKTGNEWEKLAPVPVIDPFTTAPNTGFRYTSQDIWGSTPMLKLTLAIDATCAVPVGEEADATAVGGASTLGLSVAVPRGTYAMCAQLARKLDFDLLPSQTEFSVQEYGLSIGQFMYANTSTAFSFTLDAVQQGKKFEAALFSGEHCTGDIIFTYAVAKTWLVEKPGMYYPCVREAGPNAQYTTAPAAPIEVVDTPSIEAMKDLPENKTDRGLRVSVTLANVPMSAVIAVGLFKDSACQASVVQGTSSGGLPVTLAVPFSSPDKVAVCVTAPYYPTTTTHPSGDGESAPAHTFYLMDNIVLTELGFSSPSKHSNRLSAGAIVGIVIVSVVVIACIILAIVWRVIRFRQRKRQLEVPREDNFFYHHPTIPEAESANMYDFRDRGGNGNYGEGNSVLGRTVVRPWLDPNNFPTNVIHGDPLVQFPLAQFTEIVAVPAIQPTIPVVDYGGPVPYTDRDDASSTGEVAAVKHTQPRGVITARPVYVVHDQHMNPLNGPVPMVSAPPDSSVSSENILPRKKQHASSKPFDGPRDWLPWDANDAIERKRCLGRIKTVGAPTLHPSFTKEQTQPQEAGMCNKHDEGEHNRPTLENARNDLLCSSSDSNVEGDHSENHQTNSFCSVFHEAVDGIYGSQHF